MSRNKLSYLNMKKCLNDPVFKTIAGIISRKNLEAYVIGGYVRDCLLSRPNKDIDIVVLGSGIDLAREVSRELELKHPPTIFKNFGTAMIQHKDKEIEFVGARKESYRRNSRKPVVEEGTLADDLLRRDFTINAMALHLHPERFGEMLDPFQGRQDLEAGVIRTPQDPDKTFDDDPLRMLRAIRFASQLEFQIDDQTFEGIRKNKSRIPIISAERISEELNKILLSPKPSAGFILLEEGGLLELILPELQQMKGVETRNGKKHKDNFYHTLKVLDNISRVSGNLWLRWAALLHDIAKPHTKKFDPQQGWTFHGHEHLGSKMVARIFRKLKLPLNDKMKYVQKIVLLHQRPMVLSQEEITDGAVRRLVFEAGDELDDLLTLCEADITSKNPRTIRKHLANFQKVREKIAEVEERDSIRNFQPPVSGETIMDTFGIKPSKNVGIIKDAIKEAILDGIIPNEPEAAFEYMLEKGKELGLKPK